MPENTTTPLQLLQHYWHHDHFRPLQEEIIRSVIAHHDTLALLPTGGGKSLCYQLPAMAMEGIALVISPLVALMKDQVQQLRLRNIPAAYIVSGMSRREIEVILNNAIYGKVKLLYVSPERLGSRTFIEHLRQMPVSLIAVDEAHCISQWGYDFRPPYLEIGKIRAYHPEAPIIAVTATATPEVAADIQKQLEFKNGRIFQSSFLRPNLSYSVFKEQDKLAKLLAIVRGCGGSGIVYVRNRRRTIEVAKFLNDNDIAALAYHAGIDNKERDKRQQQWTTSTDGVMVATNAFGMGIDKANVRFVVHLDLPESPEAYFQEAGRSGRDGRRSYAVILYNDGDVAMLKEGLERDFPPVSYIKNVYRGICNYYQVPVGAGLDSHYDFQLEAICQSYNFEPYMLFSALKFLEREGLVALPEHAELQSRLFILIGKEELYRYQVAHQQQGDMIATILRLYGGLFADFVPIGEKLIAQYCGTTETNVINMLQELHRLQIVDYQKRTTHPQIVFTAPRIDVKDLVISEQNYAKLRQASWQRRQAIIQYASNDKECRSRQLLHYFGETAQSDCGCCDVCLRRHKERTSNPDALHDDEQQQIMAALADTALNIKQLAQQLPNIDRERLATIVRELLDQKKLTMDQDFRISCNSR